MRWALLPLLALVAVLLSEGTPSVSATTTPVFTQGTLSNVNNPTSLAFGPDGRLYVAAFDQIKALTLSPDGLSVTATETIATSQTNLLGIAFDPTDSPSAPVTVYASRQNTGATGSYQGVISKFTAPSWTRSDVITGLPYSAPYTNHQTNGIAFDSFGKLYIAQGSNTDAGLQGPNYPETPLSAAILVADIHAQGFNGTITYSPSTPPTNDNVNQTGGDVSVFAAGTRNPYDLVVHSNGLIYATDNGAAGPNTSISCTMSGTGVSNSDELNLIESGNYYGFPNRNRGRTDTRQCTYHAPEEGNGAGFTAPISILPAHCSCDGITEYTSSAFAGKLLGDLIIAEWSFGNVVRADLAPDGRSVASITTIASGLSQPLDVTMNPAGILYVAELSGNRITYLAPTVPVGGETELAIPARSPAPVWWPIGLTMGLAAVVIASLLRRRRENG
jgi:glucose/arabinose dehydrogenase